MSRLVLPLVVGLFAGCASTALSHTASRGPLIPGDPRLDLEAVTLPSSRTFDLSIVTDGGRQPFGTLTEDIRRAPDGGLVRVQRLASPRGTQVDSLVSTLRLSPVSHHSRNPGRTVDLRYAAHKVTGTYTNAGAAPVVVDDALDSPAFDSNVIDLVARAVPLDPGFTSPVQTYERASADATETDVTYTVRTVGRDVVGGRETVVVEFSKGGTGTTRLYLDPETRAVVRQESEVAPGTTFVMEPS